MRSIPVLRLPAALLAAALILLAAAAGPASAARGHAASHPTVVLTVTNTGTYSDDWVAVQLGASGGEHLSWTATQTARFQFDPSPPGGYTLVSHHESVTMTGNQTSSSASSGSKSCTATGGVIDWHPLVTPETPGVPSPADFAVGGAPPEVLLTGSCPDAGPTPQHFECEPTDGCIMYPSDFGTARFGRWGKAFTSVGLQGKLDILPRSAKFGGSVGGGGDSGSITETVSVCPGAVKLCKPPPNPLTPEKMAAQKDFKQALQDALGPCLHYATSLTVLVIGGVWLSTSFTAPGGIPAGGAVISVGEIMTNATGPLCIPRVRRLVDDYRIFDDPPDYHFGQLAGVARAARAPKLAGCTGLKGKTLTYCRKLKALVVKLIAAVQHTAAVDDALLTTVNRASGAQRAGNQAALNKQLKHAKALLGQLRGALSAEAAIGKKIKHLDPGGLLTTSQAGSSVSYLEKRLAAKGITSSDILTIDPAALTAAALNPITRLVHP